MTKKIYDHKNKGEIAERFLNGTPLDHTPIIDFHCHRAPSQEYYYVPHSSPEEVIACMDRFGIDHSVIFPFGVSTDPRLGNDMQLDASNKYPDRLSSLSTLHARFPQDWLGIMENLHVRGGRGLKLISQYQGVREDDVDWSPALEYANEKKWVALHHWWGSSERLERWARDFPNVTFIVGHAAIDFKKLFEKYDNIYQCTCACFVSNYFASVQEMVDNLPLEKIIYGSDALDLDFGTGIGPIALADLPEKSKEMILGKNGVELIKKLNWNIELTK